MRKGITDHVFEWLVKSEEPEAPPRPVSDDFIYYVIDRHEDTEGRFRSEPESVRAEIRGFCDDTIEVCGTLANMDRKSRERLVLGAFKWCLVVPFMFPLLFWFILKEETILPLIWKGKHWVRKQQRICEEMTVYNGPLLNEHDKEVLLVFGLISVLLIFIIGYLVYLIQTGRGF